MRARAHVRAAHTYKYFTRDTYNERARVNLKGVRARVRGRVLIYAREACPTEAAISLLIISERAAARRARARAPRHRSQRAPREIFSRYAPILFVHRRARARVDRRANSLSLLRSRKGQKENVAKHIPAIVSEKNTRGVRSGDTRDTRSFDRSSSETD